MTGASAIRADFPRTLGFSALLDGAARLRPNRTALADASGDISFAHLDARVSSLATHLAGLGLHAPMRVLLLGGASVNSIMLLFAALRAGLDVALAPAHLESAEAKSYAGAVTASVILADTSFIDALGEDAVLMLAASHAGVRLVCTLQPMDGAVCLDSEMEAASLAGPAEGRVILRDADGGVCECEQADLLAAALDIATQAKIGADQPILSTISPMGFQGLVAGPLAALLAGAECWLHGPFGARRLADEIARLTPCHLVTPARIAPLLRDAGTLPAGSCASLILVHASAPTTRPLSGFWTPVLDFTATAGVAYSLSQRAAEPHPLTKLGERMRAGATSPPPAP